MKLLYILTFLFTLYSCGQSESTKPKQEATFEAKEESVQFPEIQSIKDGHKILTIRVSGDLSKVSSETKTRIKEESTQFNDALDQYVSCLQKLNSTASNTSENLVLEAQTARENYESAERKFVQLIEQVNKERRQ
ncbi:MAG: hypothetical protein R3A50_03465 [Saprospiraceae bacterium]